ncbi:MAG TPA: AsmA-like C-terminal region-containing protein, partial [Kiritimatiellia bacterium]|nr:AsmA-like C-terminal region-containing protein [Kiritimatiellia bacterium]
SDHPPTDPPARTLLAALHAIPPWTAEIQTLLSQLRHPQPPRLNINLHLDPLQPHHNRATLRGQTGPLAYRNRQLGQWDLEAHLANHTLYLDRIQARMDDQRLTLSGTYDLPNDLLHLHAFTDLPPQRWQSLIPDLWMTNLLRLTRRPIDLDGTFTSEFWIGPCPPAQWFSHWNGWISTDQASLGDTPIHRGFAAGRRRAGIIQLDSATLDAGAGPGRGRVEASLTWNIDADHYQGTVSSSIDLRQINDFFPPGLVHVLDMTQLQERPPLFNGTFSGTISDTDHYLVEGTINGQNLSFRDVPIRTLTTHLRVEPGIVHLDPLHFTRDTGFVNGSLHIDWRNDRYHVDLEATAPPIETLRMASPPIARGLSVFTIAGTSLVRANGVIDTLTPEDTSLDIHLSASSVTYQWLRADNLIADWQLRGESVSTTNLVVRLWGGTLHAELQWATDFDQDDVPFTAKLHADAINFRRLVEARRNVALENEAGLLSGHATLAGSYREQWHPHLTGQGHLHITEGSLLQIPLFGGLSTLLSAIYPGMGFSDQNAFRATFDVHDAAFHSRDLTISGNIISLNGRGAYHLDDTLDITVQVKPLRDGILAETLRVLTLPITKLLEFKLTGPSSDPSWRPANLPKELFLQF